MQWPATGCEGRAKAARSKPDGHTLLFHNLTFCTTTAALEYMNRAPHAIERDFVQRADTRSSIDLGGEGAVVVLARGTCPSVGAQNVIAWLAQDDRAGRTVTSR